jgi:metallo-beta-lactamase family protein
VNYLKAMLGDPKNDILFVGYQAQGTPGRDIQRYGPRGGYVALDGEHFDIRAQVHTISGYSAHADQAGLIGFVRNMKRKPRQVWLVHGDPEASAALAERLRNLVPATDVAGAIPDTR